MKQFLSICTLTVMFLGAFTQVALAQSPNVLDGAYVKETNLTKRVVPYPHLREADVMYKRRIWQEIDLRQKFNHTFYFPLDPIQDRKNLFDVIREALLVEGSLVAYSAGPLGEDDEFTFPLSADSIRTILNPVTLVKQYDDFGEVIGTVQQSNELVFGQDHALPHQGRLDLGPPAQRALRAHPRHRPHDGGLRRRREQRGLPPPLLVVLP